MRRSLPLSPRYPLAVLPALLVVIGTAAVSSVPLFAGTEVLPAVVVSSVNYQEAVSPNSLASAFGNGMASQGVAATLDANGNLPTTLDTIQQVTVGGQVAPLLYVSPGQINFLVPANVPVGLQAVSIVTDTRTFTGTAQVQNVAPGIFVLDSLRHDRGAILNGVTYKEEPFSVMTPSASGGSQQTRIVLFGSGFRLAQQVQVEATLLSGVTVPLTVEYAGSEGYLAGLDQINVVVPSNLQNVGLIYLNVVADGIATNTVTTLLDEPQPDTVTVPSYTIVTLAGTGTAGDTGDRGPATSAELKAPSAITVDQYLNIFIADMTNNQIREIALAGNVIATYAGKGGPDGSSGDGGPATSAQFISPVSLAVDRMGNLYIADNGDHRIRVIDENGIIFTLAGDGNAGFAGEGTPAIGAELSSPSGIATDNYGNLYIADTGNNRIRLVTSDGLISTLAGTGVAGSEGDGGPAQLAEVNAPNSVAVDDEGTVYFAGADLRVRAIDPSGLIRTIAGTGEQGDAGDNGSPLGASFAGPLSLAVDRLERLLIADQGNSRVRIVGLDSIIHPLAGTGTANYGGDLGPALQAEVNVPAGVTVDPMGNAYVADTGSNRVRLMFFNYSSAANNCSAPPRISFEPPVVVSGSLAVGHLQLACPTTQDTTYALSSPIQGMNLPSTVTVPAGLTMVAFDVQTIEVSAVTTATVTGIGPNNTANATFVVTPGAGNSSDIAVLAVSAPTVLGGGHLTGRVTIGSPAPVNGTEVTLAIDAGSALSNNVVLVPEAQTTADFLITTSSVLQSTQCHVTGTTGSVTVGTTFTILPNTGGQIQSFILAPDPVTGGQTVTGTITLAAAAGASGVIVDLSSTTGGVVPATLSFAPGQTTAYFSMPTSMVLTTETITVTATSNNTTTATVTVNAGGTGTGAISTFTLNPSSLTGGQTSTATVMLSAPAPSGGVLVSLSSDNPAATVPDSVTIGAGLSSATFPVNTTGVSAAVTANISATSANTATAALSIGGGGTGTGTISSFTLSPATIAGGQSSTGTVTLSAPASSGGVLINLSSNSGAATVDASLTIPAGASNATFTVATGAVSTTTTAILTATSGNTTTAALTIMAVQDSTGTISGFTLSPSSVAGGQSSTGTVTLSAPANGNVLVTLASDNNSAIVPASVTISAGQTSGAFIISTNAVSSAVTANITAASVNSVSAALSVAPAATGKANISGVTLNPSSVTGGQSSTGTITLAQPAQADGVTPGSNSGAKDTSGGVLVTLSSSDSGVTVPASVTILPGATSTTFPILTTPVTSPAAVTITGTSANVGSAVLAVGPAGTGTGTISSVTLSPAAVTGGQTSTCTVTLSAPAATGGVLVTLSSNSTGAVVPANVTILAGDSSTTFPVATTPVSSASSATIQASSINTVTVGLTIAPSGAGSGTISSVILNPSSVTGGQPSTGTVILSAPASTGGVLVTLSSDNGAATVPASVTIVAGQASATFTVATSPVSAAATADIMATSANVATATLKIGMAGTNSGTISSVTLNPSAVLGGQSSTGTVLLSTPAALGGVLVALSSDNRAATVPTSVTVLAGQSSAFFPVSTTGVTASTTADITAASANSVTASLTLSPTASTPSLISSVTLNPSSVTGGQSSTGTITLVGTAPTGGVLVSLSSDNSAATVPPSATILGGQTSTTFTVATTAIATGATANITASSANSISSALTIGPAAAGSGTIASVVLSPTSVTGGQPSTGTITLGTPAPAGGILISLSSDNGAATVPPSTTVPAGQTSITFVVSTTPVTTAATANISVTSANTISASLAIGVAGTGTGTIGSVTLSPTSVTGGQPSTGTITLNAPAPAGGVSITLSSDNSAATVASTATVPAGQTSTTFVVSTTPVTSPVTANITASSANTITVALAIDAAGAGLGNIASVTLSPASVTGGQPSTGTVTLSAAAPSGGIAVILSSDNSAATVSSAVTVLPGQTTATFGVGTTVVSSAVTANITASSANMMTAALAIAPAGNGSGTILSVTFAPTSISGGQTSTGTVTLSAPALSSGVFVTLSSDNTSATVPPSVTVASGQTTATFTVATSAVSSQTTANITATSTNTVTAALTISAASAGTATISSLTLTPSTLLGGQTSTGTIALGTPAPIGGVLVNLSSDSVSATLPASVIIAAGQLGTTFTVSTAAVGLPTTANITATSANSVTEPLTIDAIGAGVATINTFTLNPMAVIGGQSSTGTVTLGAAAPLGGVMVILASNNSGATVENSFTIPAGQTSGTFPVATAVTGSTQSVTLTATSANSLTAGLTINVTPPSQGTVQSLILLPSTVLGGTPAAGTVTLAGPAPANGIVVQLSSSDTTTATVPATVTVAAGFTTGIFTVSTSAVSSTKTATITATSANTISAALTVNPGTATTGTISGLTLNPTSVAGGAFSSGTITLAAPASANGVTVVLTSSSVSATVPASVTIAAGQTSGTFTVSTSPTLIAQSAMITAVSANTVSATLQITLTPPSQGMIGSVVLFPASVVGGTGSTGTVTIQVPAPVNGVLITLASNNAAATVPASVTIPAGLLTSTFAVTTTAVTAAQSVTITATSANTSTAILAVNPPCATGLALNANVTNLLTGSGLLQGTVTLNGPAPAGGEEVNLVSAGVNLGNVLVPAGQTSAPVNLSLTDVATLLGSTVQGITGSCAPVSVTVTPGTGL